MSKCKIAHLMFAVSNVKKSKKFYNPIMKFFGFKGPGTGDMAFYEAPDGLTIVLATTEKKSEITRNIHFAFSTTHRKQVDKFYELAIAAGGKVAPKIPCPTVYKPKETMKYAGHGNYQSGNQFS